MIIGITGFAGAGKDTVANYIREFDSNYIRLSFASRLKDMTSVLFGWNREMLEGLTPEAREEREKIDIELSNILGIDISPREALKRLGVGLRELFIHNFWASIVKHQILSDNLKNVLITDVRFKDEIEMIRSLGGIIIEVNRNRPDWYEKAKEANLIVANFEKDKPGKYIGKLDELPLRADVGDIIEVDNKLYCFITNEKVIDCKKALNNHTLSVTDIYEELGEIHPSERDWIGVNKPDYVIDNSKDLNFLKEQVKVLYENALKL